MSWIIIIILVIFAASVGRGLDRIHDILEEIRDRLPEPFDPSDD